MVGVAPRMAASYSFPVSGERLCCKADGPLALAGGCSQRRSPEKQEMAPGDMPGTISLPLEGETC